MALSQLLAQALLLALLGLLMVQQAVGSAAAVETAASEWPLSPTASQSMGTPISSTWGAEEVPGAR
jgi:hypothetical protein